jgi:hypothetical protein
MGGSSKRQTIGYRYFFDIQMGICRGSAIDQAVDELVEVRVGDRTAWKGSLTESGSVAINKYNLFGGDEGEGGVEGRLHVMMGEPTQVAPNRLANLLGGLAPGFRGVFTLFFTGMVSAINPYPKKWSTRQRRLFKGWDRSAWYTPKLKIELADGQIHAMNGVHILMECLTNRDWGRGLDPSRLNLDSYQAAADTLFDEGFGLCMRWTRQESLADFMQQVLDHIGGAQYTDPETGLLTLDLVRGGYDPQTLPLFTYDSGLVSVVEDDFANPAVAANEIVVTYRDPITNKERVARERNIGAIRAAGVKHTETVNYPGVPTYSLASRLARRDLNAKQPGLRRLKLRLDRRGYKLKPGGLFRVSAPDKGVADMVLRIGRIEDGPLESGEIVVTAIQDVFGLPATQLTSEQGSEWQAPDYTTQPAADQVALEFSYRDITLEMSPGDLATVESDSGWVGTVGLRPTGLAFNYGLVTRTGSNPYEEADQGEWCPSALLPADLEPDETSFTLTQGLDIELVAIGTAAMIGGEVVKVTGLDEQTGLVEIDRGCVDTVPVKHAAGTRIWFYESYSAIDPTEYVDGETVNLKLLTRTSSGELEESLAPASVVTLDQRQFRPYPPANVRLNGEYWPSEVVGGVLVQWAHRDRLLQHDVLVPWTDGDIGPEAGTAYQATLLQGGGLIQQENTTSTSTTLIPTEDGEYTITVLSQRDGLDSWQTFEHTFTWYRSEPMATEAGETMLTEAGEEMIVE